MDIEILAPAGGRQQLEAAVACKADAVYLGAGGFNARRNAENFGENRLADAISYCHARGVKVYVTLNTLVMDSELNDLYKEIENIAESGADSVIVQDLAAARAVRACCPTLPLHGSTQMTVHNLSGAKQLEELGFTRLIPARELSLSEIEILCKGTNLEIECFVHGALCMSVSGACYLSSVLGGRSGNRGLCAQPCRLNMNANGREYALSLKDMSNISHIAKLREIGVCSLKIEGRMKRPEYVAAAVTACYIARDGGVPDFVTLQAVFSRSGFTDGYFTGKRTLDMFGYRTKQDVENASGVLDELAALYRKETPRIPVNMQLNVSSAKPSSLTISDGENLLNVSGAQPQSARGTPIDLQFCEKSLKKTGGTPFFLENLSGKIEPGLYLSASELNNLRRDALDALLAKRSEIKPHKFTLSAAPKISSPRQISLKPALRIRAEKLSQLPENVDAQKIILPLREIDESVVDRFGSRLIAELPRLFFPQNEPALEKQLEKLHNIGVSSVLAENIGGVYLGKKADFEVFGGCGLNVLNTSSLEEYQRLGVSDLTLSFELRAAAIKDLGGSIPRGILACGRLPLMHFRACPMQTSKGCAGCTGINELTDRKNARFPVLCSDKNYSTLLNSLPLYVFDKAFSGIDFMTVYLTVESPKEVAHYIELASGFSDADFARTGGLYFRQLL